MPEETAFLRTIEAVHDAGVAAERWPGALDTVKRLFKARGATLEVFDKRTFDVLDLRIVGLPPRAETAYLDHFAKHNPRAAFAFRHLSREILTDYEMIDERAMDRDAYYVEYLGSLDLRYFMSGQIVNGANVQGVVTIQRTRREGHVDDHDIAVMRRLLPHLRLAYDVTQRLKKTLAASADFECALDWLSDGVMLVRSDGTVLYANEAMQAIVRRGDGIRIVKGRVEFASSDARTRFSNALARSQRLGASERRNEGDFPVSRSDAGLTYLISVRPLVGGQRRSGRHADARAVVFVHDPTSRNTASTRMLRDVFGLTEAEASIAHALQGGASLIDYARKRGLTRNTVYWHLRRIKEKTGCVRLPELIRKLNDVHVGLRTEGD